LFPAHRQDPMIAAKAAEAGKAFAEQEDAHRTLVAELEAALADHVMHHEQWMRATATLLPLAEQQLSLERASYAAGRATLKDILSAHVTAARARLTALEREAAVARDAVRINLLFGSDDR
jgi:outer membrane protein, heavy metal efflux system